MQDKKSKLVEIIKTNRNFRIVSMANFINRLGDSGETIACTYLLYLLTGSATVSALGLCVNLLPTVIIQPMVGPLVEKWNHKRTMIRADFLRGLLVLALAGIYVSGGFSYGYLLVVNFLVSTVECFRVPAGAAIIPSICKKEEYETQASVNSIVSTLAIVMGAAAAGIVLENLSVAVIFVWDCATFLVSGLVICFLRLPGETPQAADSGEEKYIVSLVGGVKLFFSDSRLKMLVILVVVNNLLAAPFAALEAPIVNGLLGGDAGLLSVISVAGTVGVILGSVVFAGVSKTLGKKRIIVIALTSYFFFYLAIIGAAKCRIYVLTAGIVTVANFASSFVTIWLSLLINSSFVEQVPRDMIGRGAAVFNAISTALMPVLSFLTAMIVLHIPIMAILLIVSGLSVLCTLAVAISLGRG